MRFAVFTHVAHYFQQEKYFAYGPYVREMNLWFKYVNDVEMVAPLSKDFNTSYVAYKKSGIKFSQIPSLYFKNLNGLLKSIISLPIVCVNIFMAMKRADHLHLRCPGNIGLIACFVQIFFPKKTKTAKYAGNWDPKSRQPLSYRIQKWLLKNQFLTRNMKVLVYGDWEKKNPNILPFFTASYAEIDKIQAKKEFHPPFYFLFAGNLVAGKRPLLALEIIHKLLLKGYNLKFSVFGDGPEKMKLLEYIKNHKIEDHVVLHGSKPATVLKTAFKKAHFSILPSQSEGWPKAIAEAMFFGAIPITTKVSCVPLMLDNGTRGIFIDENADKAAARIGNFIEAPARLERMSVEAQKWSQQYTLEKFRDEIKRLI